MKRPLLQSSLIALMLLFSIPSLFAQEKGTREQGIQFFEGSWSDVVAAAAEQNKLIFVDAYTVWCGPVTDQEIEEIWSMVPTGIQVTILPA
jgi:hypothetical protein